MKIRPVEVALFRADTRHDEAKSRFMPPPKKKKIEDRTRQYISFFLTLLHSSYSCNRLVSRIITLSLLPCTMVLRCFSYVQSCTEVWHHLASM
jgi:hypothetical protein